MSKDELAREAAQTNLDLALANDPRTATPLEASMAFRELTSMFSHRDDGIPTQYVHGAEVADNAQIMWKALLAALRPTPPDDLVEAVAREVLVGKPHAKTEVVTPRNGARAYSYVEFLGQRIVFQQEDADVKYSNGSPVYDAATDKAAAYASAIGDLLFSIARDAALAAMPTPIAESETPPDLTQAGLSVAEASQGAPAVLVEELEEIFELLEAGVPFVGSDEDNMIELFDVETANHTMFEAAALLKRLATQPDQARTQTIVDGEERLEAIKAVIHEHSLAVCSGKGWPGDTFAQRLLLATQQPLESDVVGTLRKVEQLIDCIDQRSADNCWWVNADDPETAVTEVYSEVCSMLERLSSQGGVSNG